MGRGIAVSYDPSLDEDAGKNAELEQELRQGLSQGQVRVVFQPLIDASTREVRGLEALARWNSPTRGNVSPEVFIRVAEKAGLIDQLGFEVLRTTVREASRWPGIGVAVNVSPLQLRNPYFASQVGDILAEAAFDPARLTIEVTEGVLISNPDQAKRAFSALRKLGVKIALDDFGSGFASIGALREFGFDRMKIDRSLIVALDHDDRNGAVLQATIALATALRLPVTAEGIETEEQAAVVRLSGCDELQGYLFGKPASAEEITSKYFDTPRALRAG
jgi:EAL domain-containing protein (putative c-di-GMP-specific phosphodiesterase class I)